MYYSPNCSLPIKKTMPRKLKPVHPGEMLREEFMKPLGLSMNKLAMDLHVPVTRIAEIVTAASPQTRPYVLAATSKTGPSSG